MFDDDLYRMVIRARQKWSKGLSLDSEHFVDESTGLPTEGFISEVPNNSLQNNNNSDTTYLPSTQKVNSEGSYQP